MLNATKHVTLLLYTSLQHCATLVSRLQPCVRFVHFEIKPENPTLKQEIITGRQSKQWETEEFNC